jgi:hypothetical protein
VNLSAAIRALHSPWDDDTGAGATIYFPVKWEPTAK